MSGETGSRDILTSAFHKFERAAHTLEERHATLKAEVARLERELVDAHRRLEAVLEALDTGVAVVSSAGELLRTNQAFDRLGLGRTGERIVEPALAELLGPDPSRATTARIRRVVDGNARELSATAFPVGDEPGSRVVALHDITEIRREAEEGGRQQRLEALGRMAAELAHEVRNPLGGIRLFASMLAEDLAERPPMREMADQILAATAGLEATVSNLLSFATSSSSRVELGPVDLAAVAGDVCSLLGPACSLRRIRLEGPDPELRCEIQGDAESLRQALLNLVGNALAASDSGDHIRVAVEHGEGQVVVTVRDSGRGIAARDLPRVFDPFFSRTEGGTGLGLSIVHGIVERHGGRITLDSRPGCGTLASVELPVTGAAEAMHG